MSSEEDRAARQDKLAREYDERFAASADYGGRKDLIARQKQAKRALKQQKKLNKTG